MKITDKGQAVHYGFTLLELLVSIGVIAILAAIVILALNPEKNLGDANNAKRRIALKALLNGVYQYQIDYGTLPKYQFNNTDTILVDTPRYICRVQDGNECFFQSVVDLGTISGSYVSTMPIDPDSSSTFHTDYRIWVDTDGRLHADAPLSGTSDNLEVAR